MKGKNMTRLVVAVLVAGAAALAADASSSPASVTFNKDVLPILQKNCQICHRPGQVAPMSLLNYLCRRPGAKAMNASVASRKLPPWFADPHFGCYLNDRPLNHTEIDTIAKWSDN